MTARLTDPLIEPTERTPPAAINKSDNDVAPTPVEARSALPVGHPGRPDAAEIRRLSWRRRRVARTTGFRHRRQPLELRP